MTKYQFKMLAIAVATVAVAAVVLPFFPDPTGLTFVVPWSTASVFAVWLVERLDLL